MAENTEGQFCVQMNLSLLDRLFAGYTRKNVGKVNMLIFEALLAISFNIQQLNMDF